MKKHAMELLGDAYDITSGKLKSKKTKKRKVTAQDFETLLTLIAIATVFGGLFLIIKLF